MSVTKQNNQILYERDKTVRKKLAQLLRDQKRGKGKEWRTAEQWTTIVNNAIKKTNLKCNPITKHKALKLIRSLSELEEKRTKKAMLYKLEAMKKRTPMQKPKIKKRQQLIYKSTAETYLIKNEDGDYVKIIIDDRGEGGHVAIFRSSDTITASFWNCGMAFKKFLSKIGIEYFADKATPRKNNFFLHEDTLNVFKKEFQEALSAGLIDNDELYELNKELEDLKVRNPKSINEFYYSLMFHGKTIEAFYYDNDIPLPSIATGICPYFNIFWERTWIPFTQQILQIEEKSYEISNKAPL